jgi:hypothetical protein
MQSGFASPLWPYIARVESVPKVLAGLIGIMVFFFALAPSRAETRLTTEVAIGIAVLLFLCAFLGIWQYRRNRRSLRAILQLFQMTGMPLAIGFAGPVLAVSYVTGAYPVYAAHWLEIVIAFLSLILALSVYYAGYRAAFRAQYASLAACREAGSISADDLYDLLSFHGQSTRMTARLPLMVGVSVPLFSIAALALNHLLHRDIRETLGFGLFFCVSAYFMAVLIARRWLQWKYLNGDDLTVVG